MRSVQIVAPEFHSGRLVHLVVTACSFKLKLDLMKNVVPRRFRQLAMREGIQSDAALCDHLPKEGAGLIGVINDAMASFRNGMPVKVRVGQCQFYLGQ